MSSKYLWEEERLNLGRSWISGKNGEPVDFFKYLPYGETQVSEYWGWDTPYKFSGKEKDEETGYSYFGARYYWDDLSIWLSVDPMADKYPSTSPYMYCNGNPIMLVDPNGMDWFENEKTGSVYYCSEYGKGDVGKGNMSGEGWKWMGGNDMLGKVDNDFLNNNKDFSTGGNDFGGSFKIQLDGGGSRDGFEISLEKNAKAFMNKYGYNKQPLLADVHVTETTQILPDASGPADFTRTDISEYNDKVYSWKYVKKRSRRRLQCYWSL